MDEEEGLLSAWEADRMDVATCSAALDWATEHGKNTWEWQKRLAFARAAALVGRRAWAVTADGLDVLPCTVQGVEMVNDRALLLVREGWGKGGPVHVWTAAYEDVEAAK